MIIFGPSSDPEKGSRIPRMAVLVVVILLLLLVLWTFPGIVSALLCIGLGIAIPWPKRRQSKGRYWNATAFLICFLANRANPSPTREQEVIRGLDQAQARREVNLGGYSVTEHYTVHNSRFNAGAEIVIEAVFSRNRGKTYQVVSRNGSSVLQTRVLEKLLKEEGDMSHGYAWQQSRVISANYKIRLVGEEVIVGRRRCDELELVPRVKSSHVVQGRAWVDAKDYTLVKIEGRLSLSPSFLAGRPMIVRDYETIGGFAFAKRSHAVSDSLLLGRTELTIEYSGYKLGTHDTRSGARR